MSNGPDLVTYDEDTRELSSVPDSFDARGREVLSIAWRPGVNAGADVTAGMELADIQWDDNSLEAITAPDDCVGQISSVNRNIMFEDLPFAPSQWLLILV